MEYILLTTSASFLWNLFHPIFYSKHFTRICSISQLLLRRVSYFICLRSWIDLLDIYARQFMSSFLLFIEILLSKVRWTIVNGKICYPSQQRSLEKEAVVIEISERFSQFYRLSRWLIRHLGPKQILKIWFRCFIIYKQKAKFI